MKRPIGYETVWKDRPGRYRPMVKTKYGMEDKRVVKYLEYHKKETRKTLKGYVIVHLDNDTNNFDKNNLVKVKKEVWLLVLSHKLLFNDKELNKIAIKTAELMYLKTKKLGGKNE